MGRKILYSPGFGAGWSTWNSGHRKLFCTWEPLIEAVERGELIGVEHPAVLSLVAACREASGDPDECVCLLGIGDLRVAHVGDGPVRIDEYDGSESVFESQDETYV